MRAEPALCGLRYGVSPSSRAVGGLADTVIDANEMALMAGAGTGIQFAPVTATISNSRSTASHGFSATAHRGVACKGAR